MHISVPSAHWPLRRSEERSHRLQRGFPKRQAPGSIPDQRRENVSFAQRQTYRHTEGFLSPSQKDAAVDFPHPVQGREFIVQNAGEEHQAVCFYVLFLAGNSPTDRTPIGHSMNHAREFSRFAGFSAIVSFGPHLRASFPGPAFNHGRGWDFV
jgi:hypothetical protein